MALTFEAIVGTVTYNLNNGTSLWLEESDGLLDESPARRLSERGPEQHGETDLGVRLDPRYITLRFNLRGATGTALEAYRDNLRAIFQPTSSTPIKIRITRDDGSVRQIDCYRTGPVGIPLAKENRPGHMNRAVVQLKAPDPNYYNPTQQAGTLVSPTSWWLAGGLIGSANVLEHTESPGTAQAWSYTGTVTAGSPWMIAFRSDQVLPTGLTYKNAFSVSQTGGTIHRFIAGTILSNPDYIIQASPGYLGRGSAMMVAGTYNYFLVMTSGSVTFYRSTTALSTSNSASTIGIPLHGTSAYWRGVPPAGIDGNWPAALPRAAIYNIAPSAAQLAALDSWMTTGGTTNIGGSIVYPGDWQEYPVIRIDGPISDPVLTNASTGETLDFTGYTIGSGDYYEIDTRYGYKAIRNSGGDNKIGQMSSDSDLETFHLAPDQEVAGGVNILSLSGTATGSSTGVAIYHYNRYTGP